MSNTPNLDLRTDFTGMGLNAGSQLGENFKKIDAAMAGGGGEGGGIATADNVLLVTIREVNTGELNMLDQGMTVGEALMTLQDWCQYLGNTVAQVTADIVTVNARIDALQPEI